MCSPASSLYPPVLTPLSGRPPGNKSRLSNAPHHTTRSHTRSVPTHTLSVVNTRIESENGRGVQRGEMDMGVAGWS